MVIHTIQLKHSIVSGKREIWFDNDPMSNSKSVMQGKFEHMGRLAGHEVRVTVEDTFDGYVYDLVVDDTHFHRLPRKSAQEISELREKMRAAAAAPAVDFKTDFASFTGKGKSVLDGPAAAPKKKQPSPPSSPEEGNLLGDLDWATSSAPPPAQQHYRAPPAAAAAASTGTYNPFDDGPSYFAPQPPRAPAAPSSYDPFGGYGAPAPAAQPGPYGGGYPPAGAAAPSYDPFATLGAPPPAAQQPPQQPYYGGAPAPQQPRSYDPFA